MATNSPEFFELAKKILESHAEFINSSLAFYKPTPEMAQILSKLLADTNFNEWDTKIHLRKALQYSQKASTNSILH